MRIALISDLHIDINEAYGVLEAVADRAAAEGSDVLVIAGDISETPAQSIAAVEQLASLCGFPVYYVPGNHDMWNKNCPELGTDEIDAMFRRDERCLSGRQVILEKDGVKLALTGEIGWYDYSLVTPDYTKAELDSMSMGGRTWQDKRFNQWTTDNGRQMAVSLERLEAQLSACGQLPILAVTHMLPVRDFCVPESRREWNFFNAFLGSTALDALYRRYPVRWSVCGHVHYRSQVHREGITYICPCLGYWNEWPLFKLDSEDVTRQVANAMYMLDIGDV